MSSPELIVLARRTAALSRHYGGDHPKTLAALSQWRVARLVAEIEALTGEERAEIAAALAAAR